MPKIQNSTQIVELKPGDQIYWWSELVTIVRKAKRGYYLCHREESRGTKTSSGEPFYYPARDQEIHGSQLSSAPNYALGKIVADFITSRGGDPSKDIH